MHITPKEMENDISLKETASSGIQEDNSQARRIWISPFQNEPVCKEKDVLLLAQTDDTAFSRQLKKRPKTVCVMRTEQHDIAKSKHEVLVKLLNAMETKRLRRTAFSPRCKSACSFEEKINDIGALRSFYEIYLGKSNEQNTVPEYRNSAAVIFRRLSDSMLAPQPRKTKAAGMNYKSDNQCRHSASVSNVSESNRKMKSDFKRSGKHNRLQTVPITNVQIMREEAGSKLDKRKKIPRAVSQTSMSNASYSVAWNKIPNVRIDDDTDGMVLENLEYELTGVDKDHNNNKTSRNGAPYSISTHRNYVHRPGNDYSSTSSSRTQSSTRNIGPQIIINDEGDIRNVKLQKAEYPTKRTCISDNHQNRRKFDVKINTLINNDAENEEDEILYQSVSMKERLVKSRSTTEAWTDDLESLSLSDVENKNKGLNIDLHDRSRQDTLNENDICLNSDDSKNNKLLITKGSVQIKKIDDTLSKDIPSNKIVHNSETTDASKNIFVKRNNFLTTGETSVGYVGSSELNQTKGNANGTSKVVPKSNELSLQYERSKSAIVITRSNKNSENADQAKKLTRPKSSMTLGSNKSPRGQGKSARSAKSSKSVKPTKEEKMREKERMADLKKFKALEAADKQREKKNKELADEEQKLAEQKKELEDDLLREEEELQEVLNERKITLAQERKLKRKEEADKRRQEVERRREEKRLADLEIARKNSELAALAREEKEKAEALQAELKRLEEEGRRRILEEEELERQRQKEREEEEKRELEKATEQERLELLRIEEDRKRREEVIMAAELKLKLIEEEQERQREQQKLEQIRIKEEKELLLKRERTRLQEERRRREEEFRKEEEKKRRAKEEEDRRKLAILERKRENLVHRKGLAYTKYNQRITKPNEFSYFVQVPRQVWELPIGWQKRPKYKAGGSAKK